MGRYATTSSFSELLPQHFSGDTTTSDTAGAAIVSRHIDRAEGIVNGCIAARYDPSAWTSGTVPPSVITITEDIASWFVIRATYVQDSQVKNEIYNEYKKAQEFLDQIKAGTFSLTDTNGSLIATRASGRILSSTDSYTNVFDLDAPENWDVSTAQKDDMKSSRED